MADESAVFEETYQDYLARIAGLDLNEREDKLGIQVFEGNAIIPFFGKAYTVSGEGIYDPGGKKPHLSTSVILCKYLLMCPLIEPLGGNWVSFKDFKDAAPLVNAFYNTVTRPIAETFCGRLKELENAAKNIGGHAAGENFSYDLSVRIEALPKVPVLLLFNDADEEFPAQCSVLFETRAGNYLDMECLAMLGMLLFEYLKLR